MSSIIYNPQLNVAFVRELGDDRKEIRVIPSRGGTDHRVAEIHRGINSSPAWSRDGQWLAISARENSGEPGAIFLVSVKTGEKRRLTTPDATVGGDMDPAFSPDNRRLAFVRVRRVTNPNLAIFKFFKSRTQN